MAAQELTQFVKKTAKVSFMLPKKQKEEEEAEDKVCVPTQQCTAFPMLVLKESYSSISADVTGDGTEHCCGVSPDPCAAGSPH